ncbi:MAG: hypothetical protein CMI60_23135 [Parvibaculum sp.]|nr:hypothetical protein [Parvibaculum sp.]
MSVAHADKRNAPPDMQAYNLQFTVYCLSSFARMTEFLNFHNEKPVMLSRMSAKIVIAFFTNKEFSKSTLVVLRKGNNSDDACIFWHGTSNGESFSLNLDENFPESIIDETEL